jgi:hypothetical protein
VLCRSPSETIAVAGDCVIVLLGRTLSSSGVEAVRRALERITNEHERAGYFSVMNASALRSMDAAARDLLTDVITKYTRQIAAAAMVVDGGGFRATVVRSVLTAIHLASRASHPMRAFPELAPALDWYATKRPDAKLVTSAIHRIVHVLRIPAR